MYRFDNGDALSGCVGSGVPLLAFRQQFVGFEPMVDAGRGLRFVVLDGSCSWRVRLPR
jgi:hypothetical protein